MSSNPSPETSFAQLESIREAYGRSDIEELLRTFDALASSEAKSPEALFMRGLLMVKWEQLDEAIELMREVLDLQPDFVPACIEIGQLHYHLGNHTAASIAVAEASAMRPKPSERQKLVALHQGLTQVAAELLLIGASQVEAQVGGEAPLREVGRCIGVFLGKRVDDISTEIIDDELFFRLRCGREIFFAQVEEGVNLAVYDEGQDPLFTASLLGDNQLSPSDQEEFDFALSDQGLRCFLRFIVAATKLLGVEPDALYYVIHGEGLGEWEEPISFELDEWEALIPVLSEAKAGWQIDYFLSTDDLELEGHANPALQIKVFVSADPRLIERLAELRDCA